MIALARLFPQFSELLEYIDRYLVASKIQKIILRIQDDSELNHATVRARCRRDFSED